jgi:hypothetical protein
LAKLNPFFPFLIRPMEDLSPYIIASYGKKFKKNFKKQTEYGREEIHQVPDFTEEKIEQLLQEIIKKGETLPKRPLETLQWADIVTPDERIYFQSQDFETLIGNENPNQKVHEPSEIVKGFPIPIEKINEQDPRIGNIEADLRAE